MPENTTGPIFIVGAPRTGTTLVREILNLHPEVHLYDEVHFCERIVDRFGDRDSLTQGDALRVTEVLLSETTWAGAAEKGDRAPAFLVEAAGPPPVTYSSLFRAYLETEAAVHGKSIWGDSSPQDVLYMDRLKSWFPEAKFVAVVRDPRAYLASYKNYVKKGVSSYRNRYNPLVNSLLWKRYMTAILDVPSRPWGNDVLSVKYEELVDSPEATVRNLCNFLDLDFNEKMLQVGRRNSSYISVREDYQNSGITRESLERWRESLTPAEQWVMEKTAGEQMRTLGYEPEIQHLPPSAWPSLVPMALMLPGRLYNMLFRNRKPFTFAKLRKVLGRGAVQSR